MDVNKTSQVPEGTFTKREMTTINSQLPVSQIPFHYAIHAEIRYRKQTQEGIIVLTSHFLFIFTQKQSNKGWNCTEKIHFNQIQKISHQSGQYLHIKTEESKLICVGHGTTRLVQYLYRNYQLSYNYGKYKKDLLFQTDKPDLFPEISLTLSPSQVFQFRYFAEATFSNIDYRHDFVQYIHHMSTSGNYIVDLSILGNCLFMRSDYISLILNSLHFVSRINGFVLKLPCPNFLIELSKNLSYFPKLEFLHLPNLEMKAGLQPLALACQTIEGFGMSHINLSGNQFEDFVFINQVLQNSTIPLVYLNLNNCSEDFSSFHKVFKSNPKLNSIQHFYIAGCKRFPKADSIFKEIQLETLDISNTDSSFLELIKSYPQPLKTLILRKWEFDEEVTSDLISIIQQSKTLCKLDISYSNIRPDDITEIVKAINENTHLAVFSLKINGIELHADDLEFIISPMAEKPYSSKWKSLSFNSCYLSKEDLEIMLQYLSNLDNLTSISLDNNFSDKIEGISKTLKQILSIKSLENISIRGSQQNHLGIELNPFLNRLCKVRRLTSLNIQGNCVGDDLATYLTQIFHNCPKLKSIYVDGNNLSYTKTENLVTSLKTTSITSFDFPIQDAQDLIKKANSQEMLNLIQKYMNLQYRAQYIIETNRKSTQSELPIFMNANDKDVEILSESVNNLSSHSSRKSSHRTHSCITKLFGIPFPFQSINQIDESFMVTEIDVGDMKVYDRHLDFGINQTINEDSDKTYYFYRNSLVGPNLVDLLPKPKKIVDTIDISTTQSLTTDMLSDTEAILRYQQKEEAKQEEVESSSSEEINIVNEEKRDVKINVEKPKRSKKKKEEEQDYRRNRDKERKKPKQEIREDEVTNHKRAKAHPKRRNKVNFQPINPPPPFVDESTATNLVTQDTLFSIKLQTKVINEDALNDLIDTEMPQTNDYEDLKPNKLPPPLQIKSNPEETSKVIKVKRKYDDDFPSTDQLPTLDMDEYEEYYEEYEEDTVEPISMTQSYYSNSSSDYSPKTSPKSNRSPPQHSASKKQSKKSSPDGTPLLLRQKRMIAESESESEEEPPIVQKVSKRVEKTNDSKSSSLSQEDILKEIEQGYNAEISKHTSKKSKTPKPKRSSIPVKKNREPSPPRRPQDNILFSPNRRQNLQNAGSQPKISSPTRETKIRSPASDTKILSPVGQKNSPNRKDERKELESPKVSFPQINYNLNSSGRGKKVDLAPSQLTQPPIQDNVIQLAFAALDQ